MLMSGFRKRFLVALGIVLLVINLAVAALWVTLLHPGSVIPIGRAESSPVVSAPTSSAIFVGDELLSSALACPQSTTGPVRTSDHRIVGQFAAAPAMFSDGVEATLPPCAGVRLPPATFNDGVPTLRVESQITYSGKSGTVTVLTIRPNDAALSQGLYLGNPAGSLPNGTSVYSLKGQRDTTRLAMVRWYAAGRIVSLISSNVSLATLEDLAGKVNVG